MIARSTVFGYLLLAVFCCPAFAGGFYDKQAIEYLGDDAGTVDAPALNPQDQEAQPALRIALPGIRAVVTARRMVNNNQVVSIYNSMEKKLQDINAREKTVIPFKSLHHLLSPAERRQQAKCWVDAACLVQVLKNKGIDIVVASKLSNNVNNQLLLLVRIVDVNSKRTLREFLVQDATPELIASGLETKLHKALVDLEYIVEEETTPVVGSAVGLKPVSVVDELSEGEAIPESEHKRPIGMTVAKWTTLGAGLAALAAGTAFSVFAVQSEDNAKAGSTPSKISKYNKDAELNALSANISFSFGAALLISSIVLFALDVQPEDGEVAADGWIPTVGPADESGGTAIMWQGKF